MSDALKIRTVQGLGIIPYNLPAFRTNDCDGQTQQVLEDRRLPIHEYAVCGLPHENYWSYCVCLTSCCVLGLGCDADPATASRPQQQQHEGPKKEK